MQQWDADQTAADAGRSEPAPASSLPSDRLRDAERRIAELEEAVAARDQFVATVAHEMRNPMVPIVLSVDRARRLADAGERERLRQCLATLELAVSAFVRRATRVLDASRFNAGQFRLNPQPTDIGALVRAVADGYAEMARRAGCGLDVAVAEGIVFDCDRDAVQQIVENLLSNALKYGAGKPVAVSLARTARTIRVAVRDHGPGIDAVDRARIFERFERVARQGSPGGFGIGLWLVGRLAAAMGATVSVDGAAGLGSTFTLDLPAEEQSGD